MLAAGQERQRVAHLDARRLQVAGKLTAAIGLQPFERSLLPEHDVGDDALAARLVRFSYDHGVRDLARRVQHAQNLVGADAVSHGLDDAIPPPNEIEESVVVPAYQVSREDHTLGVGGARRSQRIGAEHPRSELRLVPVSQRDSRAAVHQLANLPGRRRRPVLQQHVDLAAGDGAAHRLGPPVELFGREIGATQRFGQSVHQVQPRPRLRLAQRPHPFGGEVPTGVRYHPQPGERRLDERGHAQQPGPERRHGREHGDALAADRLDHLLREGRPLDDEGRPGADCTQELPNAVHETERQKARDSVRFGQAEVGDDGTGDGPEVGVTYRHPFREAGGPGRVHDLGDVVAQPGDRCQGLPCGADGARVEDDGVGREPAGLPREQVSRRDQTTGARVGEHVLDLAGAKRLVHDDGDGAGGERAEERRGSVPASFEQDRDAVVGRDARGPERGADRRRTLPQRRIADAAASFHDGGPLAPRGAVPQQERGVRPRGQRARCSGIHRQRAVPRVWLRRAIATSIPGHRVEVRLEPSTPPRQGACGAGATRVLAMKRYRLAGTPCRVVR